MCGIAGLLNTRSPSIEADARTLERALLHRGPDDGDVWVDASVPVALAHRRLSIIDLSPAGHQPMLSPTGRYVISYNGEIYNYESLRERIGREGITVNWRGHSDTEVLLAAIEHWGIERALALAEGMFALALWDRQERRLTLARDRFGEKPLHVACFEQGIAFSSEISALDPLPGWSRELDPDGIGLFLRRGYIDTPRAAFRSVLALPPASCLTLGLEQSRRTDTAALGGLIRRYWSAAARLDSLRDEPGPDTDAGDEGTVLEALEAAVTSRLCADVPVGCLLSGGIDSSLVAALAQAHMKARAGMSLSTFCVGFTDPRFDESARARRVAAHLGTSHHELVLTPQEALKVVDELPDIYDQPFGDPSQIPTLLVSRFARKQVKVALSGDGGDELFGGYQRYQHAPRNWSLLQRAPLVLRRVAASITAAVPDPVWRGLGHIGGGTGRAGLPASLLRFSQRAKAADFIGYYDAQIDAPWGTALGRSPPPDIVTDGNDPRRPALDAMRLRDLGSYLPGDVLVKIDRASMSAGLEVRAPLLDSTLLDLAWRLPFAQLIDDGRGKLILRRLLLRHLPAELFDRPKQGFGVPIAEWLRGPLKQWAQDLLESGTLEATGLVDMKAARRLWDRHQSGIVNAEFALWNLLMLSGWLARRAARRS